MWREARISSVFPAFEYLPEQGVDRLAARLADLLAALVQRDVSMIEENDIIKHRLDIGDQVCADDDGSLGVIV